MDQLVGDAAKQRPHTSEATGADNDLVELLRLQPRIDTVANDTAIRNGVRRPGAFPWQAA